MSAQQALETVKDKHQQEIGVLTETAEMAAMDKEIAEEKCKDLEEQLETMRASLDGLYIKAPSFRLLIDIIHVLLWRLSLAAVALPASR